MLLNGLLLRQRQSLGGIGWESSLSIALFVGGYATLYVMG